MDFGITDLFVALACAALIGGIVWLLCGFAYMRGKAEGMRNEAFAWCAAFDEIKTPNWQSLPIQYDADREKQETANRLYVEVFKEAKEAIGHELVTNRLQTMKEEWAKYGLITADKVNE